MVMNTDIGERQIIVIGGGGHAAVLIELARACRMAPTAICDPQLVNAGNTLYGLPVMASDVEVESLDPNQTVLLNGVGSVGPTTSRRSVFERFSKAGFSFLSLCHPMAVISESADLGAGITVMAGAVVQAQTVLQSDALINTRASVDHHCRIGKHAHIASGATLSGGVTVGDGVHIGVGATIREGVSIGEQAIIGAGVVVLHDVEPNTVFIGDKE
jgi:sugar O-acyltransferase (sialic acid O-acetyltransferase NeuD family)